VAAARMRLVCVRGFDRRIPERVMRDATVVHTRDMPRRRLLTVFAALAGALLGAPSALAADWTPARQIGAGTLGAEGSAAQVAIDAQGNSLAAWRNCASDPAGKWICDVFTAARPAGGDWAAARRLATVQHAADLRLAMGPSGAAVLTWRVFNLGQYLLQAAVRPAGGGWEPAATLESPFPAAYFEPPLAAVDAAGDVVVVSHLISTYSPSLRWPMAFRHPAAGVWAGAELISSAEASAVQTAGAASVVAEADLYGGGGVTARTRGPDGALGPPVEVWPPAAAGNARTPDAASSSGGGAVAAWQVIDNSQDVFFFRSAVLASLRGSDGAWAPARSLTGGLQDALVSAPRAAIDASGHAAVIWSASDGPVSVALHDPVAPTLTALTLPDAARPGAAAAFSVDVRDGFAGLAGAPAWDFGDGGSATGERVVHAHAAAGAYTVAVEATDLAGNRARVERRLVVAAPPRRPRVVTGAARPLCGGRALLTGAVTPNGQRTTARFQFGWRRPNRVTPARPLGSGRTGRRVQVVVSGLRPGAVHRFRLVATNAAGTTLGRVVLLRMPPAGARTCRAR
jgi:hypothetical protein